MTQEEIEKKVQKARSVLVLDHPFFASLALRMHWRMDEGCVDPQSGAPTMATDGKEIIFNPVFVEGVTFKQLIGVIMHEVLHNAFLHPFDMQELALEKRRRANVAMDYAINPIIKNAGGELMEGCCYNPQYDGMYWKDIYKMLPEDEDNGGSGGGQGQGTGQDVMPYPGGGGGQSDVEQAKQEMKIAVQQAAAQAKAIGNIPGGIERLIDSMVRPKANWRELLHRFMDEICKDDYSIYPPNRRWIHQGVYLPSLHSEDIGRLVMVMDTSGSIGQRELDQFCSEITCILDMFPGLEIDVLYCDTQVHEPEHFAHDDLPVRLHPHGGGGTDFRPAFDYIEKRNFDPIAVIYFTDLYCNSYPDNPRYPVLWCVFDSGYGHGDVPPFGEVIRLGEDLN